MTRRTALAVVGAAALLGAAAVHLAQLISIFHAVPWIGPLFAADVAASTACAVAIVATRWRGAAAFGVLLSAGGLTGLALSSTTGLLGWHEEALRPAIVLAIAAEVVAIAALAPLALPPARRAPAAVVPRALAGGGLVAVAALHVAAAPPEWDDARSVFWLFMALAAACLALALRLAQGLDRWTWPAVALLAAVPSAGYVLSRATGIPGDMTDIGDWANPYGVAALAVEAVLLVTAAYAAAPSRLRLSRSASAGQARTARSACST